MRIEPLEDRVVPAVVLGQYTDQTSLPSNFSLLGNAGHDYLGDGSNGWIDVTRAKTSQTGTLAVTPLHGRAVPAFNISAYLSIKDGWRPDEVNAGDADGMSFGYGGFSSPFGESGSGSGLWVSLNTYNAPGVTVYHNGSQIARFSRTPAQIRGGFMYVFLEVLPNGATTLYHPAIGTQNFTVPGWNPQASWKFGFGARTGGFTDAHIVEQVVINDLNQAPVVNLAGAQGAVFTAQQPAFNWSISDREGNLKSATVLVEKQGKTSWQTVDLKQYSGPASGSFNLNAYGLGTYRVTATATDTGGLTANAPALEANLLPSPPTAVVQVATPPGARLEGAAISFEGTASSDFDGPLKTYVWSLGDDTVVTGPTPTHIYTDDGTYTVELTVIDQSGDFAVSKQTVVIGNVVPMLSAASPSEVNEAAAFVLDLGPIVDIGRDTGTYLVDWGDGTSDSYAIGGKKTHLYADGGHTRTVRVSVVDEDGTHANRYVAVVDVRNAAPVVILPPFFGGQAAQELLLAATIADSPNDTHTFSWNFGDGETLIDSPLSSVPKTYTANGVYTLTLTVSDSDGLLSTISVPVVIGDPVSISTSAPEASEGGAVILTASLDHGLPLAHDVIVPLTITGVAATDYQLSASFIRIPAGSLSGSATLSASVDRLDEDEELLTVAMGEPVGAGLGANPATTITLLDIDAAPVVYLGATGGTVAEDAGAIVLTVYLDAISGRDVRVPVAFSGTATNGTDYQAGSPFEILIPAGTLSGSRSIIIVNDTVSESAEQIIATLRNSDQTLLSTSPTRPITAAFVIPQNDQPVVSLESASRITAEGVTTIEILARADRISPTRYTIPFALSGTATNGADYHVAANLFTFEPGAAFASAVVTIVDDSIQEPTEEFRIRLGAPPAGVGLGHSQLTVASILDNDLVRVTLAGGDEQLWEGQSIPVTVLLSNPASVPTFVTLALASTGKAGIDYRLSSKEIVIAAGKTSGEVTLELSDNDVNEPIEFVYVSISKIQNSGAVPGAITTKTVSMLDNDPVVSLSAPVEFVSEGAHTVSVRADLSAPSNRDVTVQFSYSGTAGSGDIDRIGSIVIPAGKTSLVFPLPIVDDALVESQESVTISIKDLNGVEGGVKGIRDSARLVIVDNDVTEVSWGSLNRAVQEDGERIDLNVRLSQPSPNDVVVYFAYSDGSAQAFNDYRTGALSIAIPAGQLSADLSIVILNDEVREASESFTVSMIDANFATLPVDPVFRRANVTVLDTDTKSVADLVAEERRDSDNWSWAPNWFPSKRTVLSDYENFKTQYQEQVIDALLFTAGAVASKLPFPFALATWTVEWLREEYPLDGWINGSAVARDIDTGGFWTRWAVEMLENMVSYDLFTLPIFGQISVDLDMIGDAVDKLAEQWKVSDQVNEAKEKVRRFAKKVFGGYGDGTSIYFDSDFNGVRSPQEPVAATTADGFVIAASAAVADRNENGTLDIDEGRWAAAGGTDTSVGQAFRHTLFAPANYMMVTPTSTLVSKLVQIGAFASTESGVSAAGDRVLSAWGLAPRPLAEFDFLQAASTNDVEAAGLFARETQFYNTVAMTAAFFEGRSTGFPFAYLADVVIGDVAEKISAANSSLELTRDGVVASILQGTAVRIGASLTESELNALALAVASANQLIAGMPVEGTRAYLDAVVKVHSAAQGAFADVFAAVGRGTATLADLNAAHANLPAAVGAAPAFNVLPVYLVASGRSVVERNDGTTLLAFNVTIHGDSVLPVSVTYRTADGTANGSDYAAVSGALEWLPGDNTPRTILVPVHGDSTLEADEEFTLFLDQALNATIYSGAAQGRILNDDAFVFASSGEESDVFTLFVDGRNVLLQRNGTTVHEGDFRSAAIQLSGDAADSLTVRADGSNIARRDRLDGTRTLFVGGHVIALDGITSADASLAVGISGVPQYLFEDTGVPLSIEVPADFDSQATNVRWFARTVDESDSLFIGSGAAIEYIPSQAHTGIEVVIADGIRMLTIRRDDVVLPANVAPVAEDDTVTTTENDAIAVDVVENDTDLNANDTLSVVAGSVSIQGAVHGGDSITLVSSSVSLNGNAIAFDPGSDFDFLAPGASATVTIQYDVTDDGLLPLTDRGVLTITLTGSNDGPSATVNAAEVAILEGQTAANSGTFSDVDASDVVTVHASIGTIAYADGEWTWSYLASDSFTSTEVIVTATDAFGGSHSVSFMLSAENVTPVAVLASGGAATYGEASTVGFTGAYDPSSADTGAGFRYAFATDAALLENATYASSGTDPYASFVLPAGTHAIYGRIFDKDGAHSTFSVQATVERARLVVTALDSERVYGHANPTFAAGFDGLQSGDHQASLTGSLAFDTPAVRASTIGGYAVSPSGLASPNYDITFVAGVLQVTPAPLVLIVDSHTRSEGTPNPILTGSVVGIQNGDPIAAVFQTAAEWLSPVGDYAIEGTPGDGGTGLLGNYSITILPGVLTVTAATATARIVGGDLYVTGTPNRDTISISRVDSTRVRATVNGQHFGEFSPSGFIRIAAAAGNDTVSIASDVLFPAIVYGGDGHDTVTGGGGSDRVHGDAGDDVLNAGGGNDTLFGGGGNDTLRSGSGNDWLFGQEGNDQLIATTGNDRLEGGVGDDGLWAGSGSDTLIGGAGNDLLVGGSGGDWLEGGSGHDVLFSGSGLDVLYGGDGNDILYGGSGHDRLFGDGGDDWIVGGAGDDFVDGGDGNDELDGGSGSDIVLGGDGDDLLTGGSGEDLMIGGRGADRLIGNSDDDILIGGITFWDEDAIALAAILDIWTDRDRYQDRVAILQSGGGGYKLKADETVFDDNDRDTLTGSSGKDFFFANLNGDGTRDLVTDRSGDEVAVDTDPATPPPAA